jgi:hypothetical protein
MWLQVSDLSEDFRISMLIWGSSFYILLGAVLIGLGVRKRKRQLRVTNTGDGPLNTLIFNASLSLNSFRRGMFHLYFFNKQGIIITLVSLVFGIAAGFNLTKSGQPGSVVLSIIVTGIVVLFLPLRLYLSLRKLYDEKKDELTGTHFEFTPEEFSTETASTSLRAKWERIYRVREAGSFAFIYTTPRTALIIDKRSISDPEAQGLHEFIVSLKNRYPKL